MARPLRIEFEGAIYHLSARGNDRRSIFRDERDQAHFLENKKGSKLTIDSGAPFRKGCNMPRFHGETLPLDCHLMSRGDRREVILADESDRQPLCYFVESDGREPQCDPFWMMSRT